MVMVTLIYPSWKNLWLYSYRFYATGAMLTVKALYELERIQGRYAVVTMCIGGGQGIATLFERCD